jgi:hypothetical protein
MIGAAEDVWGLTGGDGCPGLREEPKSLRVRATTMPRRKPSARLQSVFQRVAADG